MVPSGDSLVMHHLKLCSITCELQFVASSEISLQCRMNFHEVPLASLFIKDSIWLTSHLCQDTCKTNTFTLA